MMNFYLQSDGFHRVSGFQGAIGLFGDPCSASISHREQHSANLHLSHLPQNLDGNAHFDADTGSQIATLVRAV